MAVQVDFEKAQVVILAGGLGTRMQGHFPNLPKALIPVAGQPFLKWQLDYLRQEGLSRVLFITGHLSTEIEKFIQSHFSDSMNIDILNEGETRRGTGGALRFALDAGKLDSHFFLLYGDSYLPISFHDVWSEFGRCQKKILMTVFHNQNRMDKGNVDYDLRSRQVVLYDKFELTRKSTSLEWIDYGLSILDRQVLTRFLPNQTADLSDIYHDLSLQNEIAGFVATERFYEVGSPQGLRDFQNYIQNLNTRKS